MCNIINMADLLIIVISEAPIKQKIICIARSVARCARTSDGYAKADALIARAFLLADSVYIYTNFLPPVTSFVVYHENVCIY